MQNNQPTTVITVQSRKSMGLALVLTFIFGPLGMLYSTVIGGITMMILTPIIAIVTLGFGLAIMWPIQLIWSCVAVNSHNNKIDSTINNMSASIAEKDTIAPEAKTKPSKGDLSHYDDANRLSDEKIKELLSGKDELGDDFIEALKFVNTERLMRREDDCSRKIAYDKATAIDADERKRRLASPSLYSDLSIKALAYIQRCSECEIEPNITGFLATFEEGYIAPETPLERIKREKWEQEQEEQERIYIELKKKREEEEAARAEKQRRIAIPLFSTIAVVGILMWVYTELIKPNSEYNKMITTIDARFANFDESATLEAQKQELENIVILYKGVEIPSLKSAERTQYISSQIASIEQAIVPIEEEIARLAEEARIKAAEEARKKEEAEIKAAVAAAAKLPVKVFGKQTYTKAGSPRDLVIPYSFTAIDKNVFGAYSSNKLRNVTLPNSITSIGEGAFKDCYDLKSINIPNSVTFIGKNAFSGCSRALASIKIPASVKWIGERAFAGCHSLSSINIPSSVTSIGKSAFSSCKIKTINIPSSVKSIGERAFDGCSALTSINIPNSVTSIKAYTFNGCRVLTSITIPNSVTSIGVGAFKECRKLASITIPSSVTSIGDYAFYDCNALKSITIPNSVRSIGKDVFKDSQYNSRGKFTIYISESSPIYNKLKSEHAYNGDVEIKTI